MQLIFFNTFSLFEPVSLWNEIKKPAAMTYLQFSVCALKERNLLVKLAK